MLHVVLRTSLKSSARFAKTLRRSRRDERFIGGGAGCGADGRGCGLVFGLALLATSHYLMSVTGSPEGRMLLAAPLLIFTSMSILLTGRRNHPYNNFAALLGMALGIYLDLGVHRLLTLPVWASWLL